MRVAMRGRPWVLGLALIALAAAAWWLHPANIAKRDFRSQIAAAVKAREGNGSHVDVTEIFKDRLASNPYGNEVMLVESLGFEERSISQYKKSAQRYGSNSYRIFDRSIDWDYFKRATIVLFYRDSEYVGTIAFVNLWAN